MKRTNPCGYTHGPNTAQKNTKNKMRRKGQVISVIAGPNDHTTLQRLDQADEVAAGFRPRSLVPPSVGGRADRTSRRFSASMRESPAVGPQSFPVGTVADESRSFRKGRAGRCVFLSSSANSVFGHGVALAALDAWTGTLAFAGQIFFDFAGYATCAIGAALCLGFQLRANLFRSLLVIRVN